jgi:GNAT superfamily N-acetyltransferase
VEARIEPLEAYTPPFDTVIGWHWREWSHGEPDADLEAWRRRLASRCQHDAIPFTLVAYLGSDPVGCLTTCHDDTDSRFPGHGPWLSGMFVIGDARNLGIGRALLRATEHRAHALGASELWLYTSEAGPFYERCGYTYAHRKDALRDNAVLHRSLSIDA